MRRCLRCSRSRTAPSRCWPRICALVKTVVDLDRIAEGSSGEEAQRRRRLTRLLVEKDPKVKLAIGVKRAVSLLAQIGTPDAIELLKELAEQRPKSEIGRLAAASFARARAIQAP